MKRQQEMMALYQQTGVNPLGGCIPMLFQMPILFALFRFFQPLLSFVSKVFFGQPIYQHTTPFLIWDSIFHSMEIMLVYLPF